MSHTPTPWRVGGHEPHVVFCGDTEDPIELATVRSAKCNAYHRDREAATNAAHIVKCVNLHDELISAVQVAREYLDREDKNDFCLRQVLEAVLKKSGSTWISQEECDAQSGQ